MPTDRQSTAVVAVSEMLPRLTYLRLVLVGFLEMGIDVFRPAGLFTPLAHAF